MDAIQQAAVFIISQVINGRNLNQVLSELLKSHPEYTAQQKGAVQDLSYGTLRFYGFLSKILDSLLNKPVQDIQIRYLLLVALYQLQYSKAPRHTVVDFAVNTVRKKNPAASGLVNAVLRNFLRNKNELIQQAECSEEGKYSYPLWWIDALKKQYGNQAENILLAGNLHPPMTLRINRRMTTLSDYLNLLLLNGIQYQLVEPDAVLLKHPLPVEKIPSFLDGMVSVQDAGAQYAANLLDVKNGMHVLDACAAPGGKSAHLLELAEIDLVALDIDGERLQRVAENMKRLHLEAMLQKGDAAQPSEWWDGIKFQRILADVPCSATGVVRRHPDIKWLRRATDIAGFAKQQLQILNALWPLLEADGKLLYATCSIFEAENQAVIKKFLINNPDATQLPIQASDLKDGQLIPNESHDGFFYALLHKQN